jgi:hypothetical protein
MVRATTLLLGPRPRSAQIRPKLELQMVHFAARHLFVFLLQRRRVDKGVVAMHQRAFTMGTARPPLCWVSAPHLAWWSN